CSSDLKWPCRIYYRINLVCNRYCCSICMDRTLMKSATGLTGSGSRDWFLQRVSAVILAVYTVVILGWILCNSGFSYEQWYGFMMTSPMKILSLLSVLSLVAHAWIGMWQVFTDYVTTRQMGPSANGLRIVLTSAVIIAVLAYAIWAIQIFWAN